MPVTDPIADFLTRVRNAIKARKKEVSIPQSRMLAELSRILLEEGYIESWKSVEQAPQSKLVLTLKTGSRGDNAIRDLQRVSRSGLRRYAGRDAIPKIYQGLGITILSTSKGVMTGAQARKAGVGGELLCKVW